MIKRILSVLVLSVIFICPLTGCGEIVDYYDRIDTVIQMSEEIQALYTEGKISFSEKIDQNNVSQYCSEDDYLYEVLNRENEFGDYYIVLIDNNIALTRTNEIFGEVEGYIVNFNEHILSDTYKVPEELGFESNTINLITVDLYDNVYTFRAKS